jgi:anti-sigma regulatory factor (Ser/Thr protein kinase)
VGYWHARLPATPAAAQALRGEMAAIARECGLSAERVNDVKLAVSEAVTNVVQHAYRDREPGDVTATARHEGGTLRIVIADSGGGMVPRTDSPGHGLGLPLIAQLTDAFEVISNATGTEIHLTFPCPTSSL